MEALISFKDRGESMREIFLIIRAKFIQMFKVYVRYPLNIIQAIVDPIIWLSPIYFLMKSFSGEGAAGANMMGDVDSMSFIVVGFIVASFLGTALWGIGFSIKRELDGGTLESNWSAPINKIAFLVGSATFQMCIAVIESILTFILCHYLFGVTFDGNILRGILFLIPCILGLMGIGVFVSGLILIAKEANAIVDLSNFLLSALSGSYFPITILPKIIVMVCFCIPVTFMNDGLRYFFLNKTPMISIEMQILIVVLSMLFFFIGGSVLFYKIEKMCRIKGRLSGH